MMTMLYILGWVGMPFAAFGFAYITLDLFLENKRFEQKFTASILFAVMMWILSASLVTLAMQ